MEKGLSLNLTNLRQNCEKSTKKIVVLKFVALISDNSVKH